MGCGFCYCEVPFRGGLNLRGLKVLLCFWVGEVDLVLVWFELFLTRRGIGSRWCGCYESVRAYGENSSRVRKAFINVDASFRNDS